MRSNGPIGRFFVVSDEAIRNIDSPPHALIDREARSHPVLVTSWASKWNWVKLVIISSSIPENQPLREVERRLFLPIHPSKKLPESRVQLKVAHELWFYPKLLKRSFVRLHKEYEVPVEVLVPFFGSDGMQVELLQASWEIVRRWLERRRREQAELDDLLLGRGTLLTDSVGG